MHLYNIMIAMGDRVLFVTFQIQTFYIVFKHFTFLQLSTVSNEQDQWTETDQCVSACWSVG